MAPKKTTAAAPAKKASSAPSHASYKGEVAAYLSTILSQTFVTVWMVVASIYWRVSADMIKDAILNVSWRCRAHKWSRHDLFASSCALNPHSQPQRGERESWRVFYHRSLKSAMVAGQSSLALNSCFQVFVYLCVAFLHRTFTDSHLPHSRPAIKKYILANNKSTAATAAVFDSQFNKALRTGVEKGDFTQPKGTGYSPKPCFSYNITMRCLHCLISSWRCPSYAIVGAVSVEFC